jgi:hypothetical protein
MRKPIRIACLGFLALAGGASAVQWGGGGTPNDSWDVDANWAGDLKPANNQEAFWSLLATSVPVYLDGNQTCDSIRVYQGNNGSTPTLTIHGTNRTGSGYHDLTLVSGNTSFTNYIVTGRYNFIDLNAPIVLGSATAAWDTATLQNGITVFMPVRESVTNTTIEKRGTYTTTGGLILYAALNITGSLWIRGGRVYATTGSDIIAAGGPAHPIRLGDTSGNTNAVFAMTGAANCRAGFVVEGGGFGSKTIAVGHPSSGGTYSGDFLLNGDLTIGLGGPVTMAGRISGAGGIIKTSTYGSGLTGNLTYAGNTTVADGRLAISGNTAGLGSFLVTGAFFCGTNVNLAAGKLFEVENGGLLYPGKPTVTGTHSTLTDNRGILTISGDLRFQPGATNVFQMGADTTAGTTYDTIAVAGNLTLDGTLLVVPMSGSNVVNGVYQVLSYSGALTDNGLDVAGLSGDYWVDTTRHGYVYLRTGETGPKLSTGTMIQVR